MPINNDNELKAAQEKVRGLRDHVAVIFGQLKAAPPELQALIRGLEKAIEDYFTRKHQSQK